MKLTNMLRIKPVAENGASGEIAEIFDSIRLTLGLGNVPLVFRYLAAFPRYLSFLWDQSVKNLEDAVFCREAQESADFARLAISEIYYPSPATRLFLEKIIHRPEEYGLGKFVASTVRVNSQLYLLSLALRESLKGKYLGIKQIGEKLTNEETDQFHDLSEGFFETVKEKPQNRPVSQNKSAGLTTSLYGEFFRFMSWEMDKLLRSEEYLARRVELEKYTLARLHLLPHPLESSLTSMMRETSHEPNFPELIYLIGDLFPTQMPYKLMASTVMKKALNDNKK